MRNPFLWVVVTVNVLMTVGSSDGVRKKPTVRKSLTVATPLVNKRDRAFNLTIPGASGGHVDVVDQQTVFQPPAGRELATDEVTLGALAVAVVTLVK